METTQQLAEFLIGDIKEFISVFQNEIAEKCTFKSKSVTARELLKEVENMPLTNKNIVKIHKIGNFTYQNTISHAISLYINLCKEFKIKQVKFDINANTLTYRTNASGFSVKDFTLQPKAAYIPKEAFNYILMDADKKAAIATDKYKLMVSPTEYNGKNGLFDKNGNEQETYNKFSNIQPILDVETPNEAIVRPNIDIAVKLANLDLEIEKQSKQVKDVWVRLTQAHTTVQHIYITPSHFKIIKKSGFDNWKFGTTKFGYPQLRKDFKDGTIIIIVAKYLPDKYEFRDTQHFFEYYC